MSLSSIFSRTSSLHTPSSILLSHNVYSILLRSFATSTSKLHTKLQAKPTPKFSSTTIRPKSEADIDAYLRKAESQLTQTHHRLGATGFEQDEEFEFQTNLVREGEKKDSHFHATRVERVTKSVKAVIERVLAEDATADMMKKKPTGGNVYKRLNGICFLLPFAVS